MVIKWLNQILSVHKLIQTWNFRLISIMMTKKHQHQAMMLKLWELKVACLCLQLKITKLCSSSTPHLIRQTQVINMISPLNTSSASAALLKYSVWYAAPMDFSALSSSLSARMIVRKKWCVTKLHLWTNSVMSKSCSRYSTNTTSRIDCGYLLNWWRMLLPHL